jgi:hypothetical protein
MADVMDTPDRKVTFGGGEDGEANGGDGDGSTVVATPSVGMKGTLQKKSSLKMSNRKKEGGTSVSFLEVVTVRELPSEEADEAMNTRKGGWEAAPNMDELWDGDNKSFWEEEKTSEEIRRIVVIRQMRMALQYNLGYAFYSMVANFKKRRKPARPNPAKLKQSGVFMEDVVPQYETPGAEETAIRKEIRELFADSVKGLDFPDLVQDREAFDKIYATTTLNISEIRRASGLGLLRIESLVDEIMNTEETCALLDVEFEKEAAPTKGKAELEAQEKIETAVGKEERRRGERRASIEALNHGVPAFGERRASIEAKRRSSLEPHAILPTNAIESQKDPLAVDDDEPIFASSGRAGIRVPQRRPSNSTSNKLIINDAASENAASVKDVTTSGEQSVTNASMKDNQPITRGKTSQQTGLGYILLLALGVAVLLFNSAYRSFTSASNSPATKEAVMAVKGSGLLGWLVPLFIILALRLYY